MGRAIRSAQRQPGSETVKRADARFTSFLRKNRRPAPLAGWISHRHALRLASRLGCSCAGDCRGSHPFIPVIEGEIVACPQLPTTLPTLDEVLSIDAALSAEAAAERILKLSQAIPGDHVSPCEQNSRALLPRRSRNSYEAGRTLATHSSHCGNLRAELQDRRIATSHDPVAEIPGRGKRMIPGTGIRSKAEAKRAAKAALSSTPEQNFRQSRSPPKAISRLSKLTKTL